MIDGFTFEIDGDPVLVKRLHDALTNEYAEILRENVRTVWAGFPPRAFAYRPLLGITGRITLRGPLPQPTPPWPDTDFWACMECNAANVRGAKACAECGCPRGAARGAPLDDLWNTD